MFQINVVNEGLKNMIHLFSLIKLGILMLLICLGLVLSKYFRKTQKKGTMFLDKIVHMVDIYFRLCL